MTDMDDTAAAASNIQTAGDGKPASGIDRLAHGDPAAFERLVAAHQQRIVRLVYRLLGWDQEAEDVAQEVFLAALKGKGKFRGAGSEGVWLTRIAINACRTHQRRRVLWRKLKAAVLGRTGAATPPPDGEAMDREKFLKVRRAVQALPRSLREVVVLRYLEGMSTDEICQALSAKPGTVHVRLHRARQELRDSLGELFRQELR